MATPPTVPTSFAPHQMPITPRRRQLNHISGIVNTIGYLIFAAAFLVTLGVLFYSRLLAGQLAAKDAQLQQMEAKIDPSTVQDFVRLHDRLSSGKQLLAAHTAFSPFLAFFAAALPVDVQFKGLQVAFGSQGQEGATVTGQGSAKTFNALANASINLAKDSRVQDVIFSNVAVNAKTGFVGFNFSATLDPSLVSYAAAVASRTSAMSASSTTP